MIKFILAAGLFLAGASAQAQIVPEKVYPGSGYLTRLSTGDYKYVVTSFLNNQTQVTLYNLNHSVYKQIMVPLFGAAYSSGYLLYLSDALFDTNPATIEYAVSYYGRQLGPIPNETVIYSETGARLAVLDSTSSVSIYNTPNGTKLLAYNNFSSSSTTIRREYTRVYSLAGTLPLRAATPGLPEVAGAYPNPAQMLVNLSYSVPTGQIGTLRVYAIDGRLIRSYQVDSHTNRMEMGTRDLPVGVYVYTVETTAGVSSGQRFIIQ